MAASICDVFAFCVKPEDARRVAEIRFINSGKGNGLFPHPCHLSSSGVPCTACDHCLRSLETAEENAQRLSGNVHVVLPYPELCTIQNGLHQQCPRCQVSYCSAECLKAALPGITHLILLNKREEAWRNIHYPPETASIMLIARMVATIKQAKDKDWWLYLFSQFCSKTANEEEEIVHKLLGDKFKGQLEQLRQLFMEALHDERVNNIILASVSCGIIGTGSPSQWVHACDALNLPARERAQLDGKLPIYLLLSQAEDPDVTSEEEDAELDGETDDAELEDEMTDV
uniref:Uncharacterized protein n=1 Tax=Leptobrachium leishanense TaxID=445787 RepID=A0A8C5N349_9ANUR